MKQEGFQVVAELYRLLATFDASAIFAASKLPGISENLRAALVALHQETTTHQSSAPKQTSATSSTLRRKNGGSLDALGLLTDSRRFPTKQALQELAKALGITINFGAKENRIRVARKIATVVAHDSTARQKLYDMLGAGNDTQTAGWIELIRRGS